MLWSVVVDIQSADSSIVRSGVITPTPPTADSSRAKFSTPNFSMGFQYDMTRAGTFTAETTCNTSLAFVLLRKAISAAC